MMNLSFSINYAAALANPKHPTSARVNSPVRLTVVGKSGVRYSIHMLRFLPPMFDKTPRHSFSTCGRFVVMPVREKLADDAPAVYTGQYRVYYNGKLMPEERYAIRLSQREAGVKKTAQYKRTRGRDTDAMTMPGYAA